MVAQQIPETGLIVADGGTTTININLDRFESHIWAIEIADDTLSSGALFGHLSVQYDTDVGIWTKEFVLRNTNIVKGYATEVNLPVDNSRGTARLSLKIENRTGTEHIIRVIRLVDKA